VHVLAVPVANLPTAQYVHLEVPGEENIPAAHPLQEAEPTEE